MATSFINIIYINNFLILFFYFYIDFFFLSSCVVVFMGGGYNRWISKSFWDCVYKKKKKPIK